MVGARVRRQQVAYARSRGLSDRRACALLMVARSTLGYQSRLVVRDAPALAAMRSLAAQYPRVRVSPDSDLLEARGPRDEVRTGRIVCGARPVCRCRDDVPVAASPSIGPGRYRRLG